MILSTATGHTASLATPTHSGDPTNSVKRLVPMYQRPATTISIVVLRSTIDHPFGLGEHHGSQTRTLNSELPSHW